jgi:hypothetical protein
MAGLGRHLRDARAHDAGAHHENGRALKLQCGHGGIVMAES